MEEIGATQRNRPVRPWENRSKSDFFFQHFVNCDVLLCRKYEAQDTCKILSLSS
jgi:hypothetical protein